MPYKLYFELYHCKMWIGIFLTLYSNTKDIRSSYDILDLILLLSNNCKRKNDSDLEMRMSFHPKTVNWFHASFGNQDMDLTPNNLLVKKKLEMNFEVYNVRPRATDLG